MENTKNQSLNPAFMTNPVIKRLKNIASNEQSSTTATYAGVISKTVFFMILTAVGIVLYYSLQQMLSHSGSVIFTSASEGVMDVSLTMQAGVVLMAAAVIVIVTALLSTFIPSIVPVTGTLYVLAEGYILAFVSDSLKEEYRWMSFTALMLTIILVFTLLLLYCSKKIKISHKFKVIISAIFITLIIGSALTFILHFIPGLSHISQAISTIMNNPFISIGLSVFFVIVACLFLISDFDTIHDLVSNNMPKKYEWSCAFGVAYTVLYLYFKILQLLIEIFGKKSNS